MEQNNNIVNEKENNKKKIPLGIKIGIIVFFIGLIVIVFSYIISYTINYNPYTKENPNPKSIKDTFTVPKKAKYNKAYHIYMYEEANAKRSYSKKMYDKHKIKDLNIKMEGGYVTQTSLKTIFSAYIYNLSETENINSTINIKFTSYNKGIADEITYTIDNLEPLESKSIEIEVDKKVINAYDYEISIN